MENHIITGRLRSNRRTGPAILAAQRRLKVSSGTVEWYISSSGSDCNKSEIASPAPVQFGYTQRLECSSLWVADYNP